MSGAQEELLYDLQSPNIALRPYTLQAPICQRSLFASHCYGCLRTTQAPTLLQRCPCLVVQTKFGQSVPLIACT